MKIVEPTFADQILSNVVAERLKTKPAAGGGNFEHDTNVVSLYTKRDQKRKIECRLGLKNPAGTPAKLCAT